MGAPSYPYIWVGLRKYAMPHPEVTCDSQELQTVENNLSIIKDVRVI